MIYGTL